MAKQKEQEAPLFEQADERGRMLLDRPFSPAEAAAQDAENRRKFVESRAGRFDPATTPGPFIDPKQGRRRAA